MMTSELRPVGLLKVNLESPELLADGLPRFGYVRIRQLIRPFGPIPFSSSTVWNLVKAGKLNPLKVSARVTVFDVAEVRALLAGSH